MLVTENGCRLFPLFSVILSAEAEPGCAKVSICHQSHAHQSLMTPPGRTHIPTDQFTAE